MALLLLIPLIAILVFWIYAETKLASSTRIISGLCLTAAAVFYYHHISLFISSYDKERVTWVMRHMASKLDSIEGEDYSKSIDRYKQSDYDTTTLIKDFSKLKDQYEMQPEQAQEKSDK